MTDRRLRSIPFSLDKLYMVAKVFNHKYIVKLNISVCMDVIKQFDKLVLEILLEFFSRWEFN